jgi:hypothetical protein
MISKEIDQLRRFALREASFIVDVVNGVGFAEGHGGVPIFSKRISLNSEFCQWICGGEHLAETCQSLKH